MPNEATRVFLYKKRNSSGPVVILGFVGLFGGGNAYYHLFHSVGVPVNWALLAAMWVSFTALGIAIGLAIRARLRRPVGSLVISEGAVHFIDSSGRATASKPIAQLPVSEGWYFQGSKGPEGGGGHNSYTITLDLAGRWTITAWTMVVVEKGFATGSESRPNCLVRELDYLRLRRLLLPERAAKLVTHMQHQEKSLRQHGIGDRHPIF